VQLGPGTVVGKPSTSLGLFLQHEELTTHIVIDNHRVLHGRSAFDGKRRMCGAYIGMDDFRSKLTVLTERFGGGEETNGQRDNFSLLF
jgi:hypothetical protein